MKKIVGTLGITDHTKGCVRANHSGLFKDGWEVSKVFNEGHLYAVNLYFSK